MQYNVKKIIRGVWRLADPKLCIASTVPMMVGAAMAYKSLGYVDIYWLFWSFLGVYLIETGKNAVNEVVDYRSGVDRFVTEDKRTPFSGGKKTIVDGLLTVKDTQGIAVATLVLAAAIGLYITVVREPRVFWIGILGFLISIFYSLPPFKLCYRGLGEIAIGFAYGPLILMGTYLVQTHTINLEPFIISLPIGFLIMNVVWINQYPDYEADTKGNKKNWLVRIGKKNGIKIFVGLFALSYTIILLSALFTRNILFLMPLLSIPTAMRAVAVAKKYYNDIPEFVEANIKTIQVYQITGLTLTLAAIFS